MIDEENNLNENEIHKRAKIAFICILSICLILGMLRVESFINKQIEIDKKQDSLFTEFYYSINDTFEKEAYLVTATTYNPTIHQCDSSPDKTACNYHIDLKNPYKHKYIGLSRDLAAEFYCGEKVKLENCGKFNGIYIVADFGNRRLNRTVDILIGKEKGGKFKNVVLRKTK